MEYRQYAARESASAAEDEGRRPLISVIIPVFNAGAFLRETLDSLLAQDFRDMEILCVNDGSTDDSGAILADYAARDGRFRILEQENCGVSRARNAGTCAARGKYLFYMDHDDLLEQGALAILAAEMERSELEYLCFNATAFGCDPESEKRAEAFNRGYLNRQLKEGDVYTGQALFRLLKTDPDMRYIAPAWACMISRAFVLENEIRFDPDILNEDELWSVQVLMKVQRAGCLNRKLYRYRVHPDSLTRRADTFAKAYSKFLCAQAIRQLISAPDFICEPGTESFLLGHIVRLQKKAAGYYAACSREEQEKRRLLPLAEQSWFESLVVLPADMEDRRKKMERELKSSPEYRIGEDTLFTAEVCAQNPQMRIVTLPYDLYYYYQRPGSAFQSKDEMTRLKTYACFADRVGQSPENDIVYLNQTVGNLLYIRYVARYIDPNPEVVRECGRILKLCAKHIPGTKALSFRKKVKYLVFIRSRRMHRLYSRFRDPGIKRWENIRRNARRDERRQKR